ncbi:MAG: cardiolipin synthase ClsB [Curvibacter lanceolatus]|uniref:cardiolipin synthase ClsB n=1 Tax=Curvibacter lanceolatus TaxID=86182 RepID=UPI00037FC5A7|nr:cardiolipin synthase ClsB [Curvibacter lanceolatus]MBV5292818.1 cardiolipin synthase ClsB [Curvibacter lanceolatus]
MPRAHGLSYRAGHEVELLQGSTEFFPALIAGMDAARHSIWLETYIFDFTGSAQDVAQALARAALRGVSVRVVVDGVGTDAIPTLWRQRWQAAGVQWRVFSPLGPGGLLIPNRWRRLHRKLCVLDGERLFCGGINVLDDWYDPHHGALRQPRFDLAVSLSGPVVAEAMDTMSRLWWRLEAAQAIRSRRLPRALEDWRQALPAPASGTLRNGPQGLRAALVLRDNLRHRARIEKAYLRAIGAAREEVLIANAYFLPGRKLRRALVMAAQRGVRVQLLLQGRYESFMQHHAARPVYGPLLAAGVEIHEYEPSFLHAKVAVVDGCWSTVGSSNLDPLSLLLAREANVVIDDREFAAGLRSALHAAMRQAGRPVQPELLARRSWHLRVLDRVAFGLMRLALWLTGHRY